MAFCYNTNQAVNDWSSVSNPPIYLGNKEECPQASTGYAQSSTVTSHALCCQSLARQCRTDNTIRHRHWPCCRTHLFSLACMPRCRSCSLPCSCTAPSESRFLSDNKTKTPTMNNRVIVSVSSYHCHITTTSQSECHHITVTSPQRHRQSVTTSLTRHQNVTVRVSPHHCHITTTSQSECHHITVTSPQRHRQSVTTSLTRHQNVTVRVSPHHCHITTTSQSECHHITVTSSQRHSQSVTTSLPDHHKVIAVTPHQHIRPSQPGRENVVVNIHINVTGQLI